MDLHEVAKRIVDALIWSEEIDTLVLRDERFIDVLFVDGSEAIIEIHPA